MLITLVDNLTTIESLTSPQKEKAMKPNKTIEQNNLHNINISETVSYQYKMMDGKKCFEGLIALGRYYPCVMRNDRFYFGIHRNERFLPGIIWNQKFIPGIVNKSGFIPGIATDSGFQFGIIAFNVFIPGIIVGRNFLPGLVREKHFIPGCYTNQGDFALGRFFRGTFENGVIDARTRHFLPTDYEAISAKATINLIKEGYGVRNIRRYEAIGGIPIAGAIQGAFNTDIGVSPSGIITNKWSIVGGLSYSLQEDGVSLDAKYLPHADQLSEMIEALGIDTSGLSNVGWSSTQDEWEGLADGLIEGAPGYPFGSGVDNSLVDGLNALGQGESGLIEDLNRGYGEYWANVIEGIKASGGAIHGDGAGGSFGSTSDGSHGAGGSHSGGSPGTGESHSDGSDNSGQVAISASVQAVTRIFLKGAVGGLVRLVVFVTQIPGDVQLKEVNPPSPPEGGSPGTNVSEGDDAGVNEGNVFIGGWKGRKPMPIEVKDPNKTESGIKIVHTDVGAMMVVNYDQLRDAMQTGPEEGMIIGLNPLTGETINIIPGTVDPKARFGQLLKQWYLNPKVNPRT